MIRIFLDDVEAKLADGKLELPKYRFSALRGVEGWREGVSVNLRVLATTEVRRLLGHCEEAYRTAEFNDDYHNARIEIDGVVVVQGVVSLQGVEQHGQDSIYRLRIRSGGADWADSAAMTRLNASKIDARREMSVADVETSWSDDSAVRMLPLNRDRYAEVAETGIYTAQQTLLPQDYHPFISVATLVASIAEESGYELCSSFLATPFARKLMISGAYKRVATEQAYASMGFKAVRSRTTTAVASQIGRVDVASPEGGYNLGALVDTSNPNMLDEDGNTCGEAYDNGGCFVLEDGVPMFRPKRDISAAFDLCLHYTTDYRIISSSRLKGFDRVYLGNMCYVDVGLPNPFRDRRKEVSVGVRYKLFIFDFDPTKRYMLHGVGAVSAAVSTVVFPTGYSGDAILMVKEASDGEYEICTADWALYDGHVVETGRRDVKVTIRMPFEQVSPTSPKSFMHIFFDGAEQGMALTLHAGCSLTPIFGGVPGYGEVVEFRDVANHDISQAEFLEAVAHMFNLCIYTHRPSRRLFVEPYDEFFGGEEVDWRPRQLGDDTMIEECVVDSFVVTRLGYQPSDGATKRLTEGDSEFGGYDVVCHSYAAKQSVHSLLNPQFLATASMLGVVGVAPSAMVLTVGDRDVVETQEYVAPRVVLYHGMESLPEGQYWPMSYGLSQYPLVAFHSPEHGETLCFEDRDGCVGLHRFYDNYMAECAQRQRITIDIRLSPALYMSLFDPDSGGATIRSRFRLRMGGGSSLFRLDEILSYDIERGVARCRFQRLMCD